jgi:hypothetical protein
LTLHSSIFALFQCCHFHNQRTFLLFSHSVPAAFTPTLNPH